MHPYQQSLALSADPASVYAALATPEGLRAWWTQDCDVATEVGGMIRLRFGRTHKEMRIERLEPGCEVRWLCVGAHIAASRLTHKDEWVGTQIVFRLTPQDNAHTRLDFEHIGLVPSLECYDMCHDGWRFFLGSLQALLETGRGTPYAPQAAAAVQ
ncbi:hypothetical protein GALL_352390 [mine drainage metagenome]|uniref:Activator of Hsp90 ATPase homologue 1/2-like C-terminal domain-containing protein n=1 Tax=mine drainage metagenome TaxID=410659 RepID=A0A1J5QZT3_9ZZZZ